MFPDFKCYSPWPRCTLFAGYLPPACPSPVRIIRRTFGPMNPLQGNEQLSAYRRNFKPKLLPRRAGTTTKSALSAGIAPVLYPAMLDKRRARTREREREREKEFFHASTYARAVRPGNGPSARQVRRGLGVTKENGNSLELLAWRGSAPLMSPSNAIVGDKRVLSRPRRRTLKECTLCHSRCLRTMAMERPSPLASRMMARTLGFTDDRP